MREFTVKNFQARIGPPKKRKERSESPVEDTPDPREEPSAHKAPDVQKEPQAEANPDASKEGVELAPPSTEELSENALDSEDPVAACRQLMEENRDTVARICSHLEHVCGAVNGIGELLQREKKRVATRLERIESCLQPDGELSATEAPTPSGEETEAASAGMLAGSLAEISVADAVEFARLTKKTGQLRIDSPELQGFMNVLEGEVIYAKAAELEEFDAFYEMLAARSGSIEFRITDVQPDLRNLKYNSLQLLMRAVRLLDESSCEMRR